MPEQPNILTDYYALATDPFDPPVDPKTKFDFRMTKVSLLRELNIFRHEHLRSCFIEVGPFARAVTTLRDYFTDLSYDPLNTEPPMILIQGTRGTGLDTMAYYAAYLVKEAAPATPLVLESLSIETEAQAKFLVLVKQTLETHVKETIPEARKVFDKYQALIDPKDPDQGYLQALLRELKPPLAAAPALLLTVGPITWDRRDWIGWLYKLLKPLNVLLILLTEETRVARMFDDSVENNTIQGKSIRLEGLTLAEGREFVEQRLTYFRGASPVTSQLFPFADSALTNMFEPGGGRVAVKFLIQVLRNSMNRKMAKLAKAYTKPAPPPNETQITWDDVIESYRAVIRTRAT